MPNVDFIFLLIEMAVLITCARFAWQAWTAAREVRDLVETASALLGELKLGIAAADARMQREEDGAAEAGGYRHERAELGQVVRGLASLGMSSAEIAQQIGMSRGEADLLLKVGGRSSSHAPK